MSLIYRFRKEELEDGSVAVRPRIPLVLKGKDGSIEYYALLDSGCDVTVIPEKIADALGLDKTGKKNTLFGYNESSEVIESNANFIFIGRANREEVNLNNIPVLITCSKESEEDVVLGISGIFDSFDITFKKLQNRIVMKRAIVA